MSLVDNRIARVPSLRVNAYSLIPTASEDIEQIEVVSGPGAALYGPNSANGVMHILDPLTVHLSRNDYQHWRRRTEYAHGLAATCRCYQRDAWL